MILERAKASAVEEVLAAHGGWEAKYGVQLADVEGSCFSLLSSASNSAIYAYGSSPPFSRHHTFDP